MSEAQAQDTGDRRKLGRAVGADIKVLELGGPIAPERNLNAGARRPSERGMRKRCKTRGHPSHRHGQIVETVHHSGTAGHVRHEPIKSQTEATAPGRERSDLYGFCGGAAGPAGGRKGILLYRPLAIDLSPEDEHPGLPAAVV